MFACGGAERNVQTCDTQQPCHKQMLRHQGPKHVQNFKVILDMKQSCVCDCPHFLFAANSVATASLPLTKCSIINSVSFMHCPGVEKPTFKKAGSSYEKANCLRPETVLPAVLTSPQPWLITLLR